MRDLNSLFSYKELSQSLHNIQPHKPLPLPPPREESRLQNKFLCFSQLLSAGLKYCVQKFKSQLRAISG